MRRAPFQRASPASRPQASDHENKLVTSWAKTARTTRRRRPSVRLMCSITTVRCPDGHRHRALHVDRCASQASWNTPCHRAGTTTTIRLDVSVSSIFVVDKSCSAAEAPPPPARWLVERTQAGRAGWGPRRDSHMSFNRMSRPRAGKGGPACAGHRTVPCTSQPMSGSSSTLLCIAMRKFIAQL